MGTLLCYFIFSWLRGEVSNYLWPYYHLEAVFLWCIYYGVFRSYLGLNLLNVVFPLLFPFYLIFLACFRFKKKWSFIMEIFVSCYNSSFILSVYFFVVTPTSYHCSSYSIHFILIFIPSGIKNPLFPANLFIRYLWWEYIVSGSFISFSNPLWNTC